MKCQTSYFANVYEEKILGIFFLIFRRCNKNLSSIYIYTISSPELNLSRIGSFTRLTPPGPYRATTCRERELIFGYHIHTFWPHKDMEGLPGWVISSMPGPPPRQHKHERRYTPGTHSFIRTRRIWNYDYGGQMIFGDLVDLKFPDICVTRKEKHRKNLTQETCPDRESIRARCLTDAHATACSTAVDIYWNRERRVIGISGSPIWPETLTELIFNPCAEFRWSPEGPVNQIQSSHLHVGAPAIF